MMMEGEEKEIRRYVRGTFSLTRTDKKAIIILLLLHSQKLLLTPTDQPTNQRRPTPRRPSERKVPGGSPDPNDDMCCSKWRHCRNEKESTYTGSKRETKSRLRRDDT